MKKLFQNKTFLIILSVVCIAALAVGIAFAIKGRNGAAPGGADATLPGQPAAPVQTAPEAQSGQTAPAGTGDDNQEQNTNETAQQKPEGDATAEGEAGGDGVSSYIPSARPSSGGNKKPAGQQAAAPVITFPYAVPDTGLVIQSVLGYEGPYLEDGGEESVSGVAAAVVINQGSTDVEYARLVLQLGGKDLTFTLTDLPAGAGVAVQEADKTSYPGGDCTGCASEVAENPLEQSEGTVLVEEQESGTLKVTNLTGEKIPCVRIFYKYYLEEEASYLGGITFTAKLTDLEADTPQEIMPGHYLAGYSRVVMVRTYDTAD